MDERPPPPAKPAAPDRPARPATPQTRHAREAAALRANLRKRKDQARAREATPPARD
jgi:hypothetical protein